jgi:hypothetical protein
VTEVVEIIKSHTITASALCDFGKSPKGYISCNILAPDGGYWSASRSGRFVSSESAPDQEGALKNSAHGLAIN